MSINDESFRWRWPNQGAPVDYREQVRIAKDMLSGFTVATVEEMLPGAPRVAQKVSNLLDDLILELDQQVRALDDFAHAAHKVLEGDSYVGTTPEMVAAARTRLAVLAGKYDRPVTSVGAPPDGESPQ